MVRGSVGVQNSAGAVQTAQRELGSVLSGRLRVPSELSNASVLVSSKRARTGGGRRFSSSLVTTQPVAGSAVHSNSSGSARNSSSAGRIRDAYRPSVANAGVVVATNVDGAGAASSGTSLGGGSSSGGSEQAQFAEQARAYLYGGGIQSLRAILQRQGYYPDTIQRIVGRWEQGSGTLSTHRHRWDTVYVPWCSSRGLDALRYDVVQVANFLESEQKRFERGQDTRGVSHNHAGFKASRAAVCSMLQLLYPHLPRLALHPHVAAMAAELRKSAPNLAKYVETISLDPLFEMLVAEYKQGSRFDTMPLIDLRDRLLLLLRISGHGRSADLAVINRGFAEMSDKLAGLQGSAADFKVNAVRYDFNKTWKSTGSRFSPWKYLPSKYLAEMVGFQPEFSLCCVRAAMEEYLRRTYDLPLSPYVDVERPSELVFRLFVTATAPAPLYKHTALKADTIAGRLKLLLKKAGIDVNKFQPHILRSASMAARIAAGEDVDNVLRLASVSRKVFSTYYELPMGGETSGSVASSIGAQAARLALQHSNGSQVPALANASGAVLALQDRASE